MNGSTKPLSSSSPAPFRHPRNRRTTWLRIAAAISGATVALAGWAFWLEPARLVVSEQRIAISWPLRGTLRVAVVTDLHIGSPFNGIDKLRTIVNRTNDAKPDIICILGDLVIQGVIGGRFVAPEEIAAELKHLRAPGGVMAVLGNHGAWLDHDRVLRALEQNGVRVLEEKAAKLDTPAITLLSVTGT